MTKQSVLVASILLAGAILSAPVVGAVGALFWSPAADTNDAQNVAGVLYEQLQLDPSRSAYAKVHTQRCGEHVHRRLDEGDITLIDALSKFRRGLLRSKYDNLAVNSLAALPAPVLGALNGCANGSPAWSLCLAYVNCRVVHATTIPHAKERAWIADVDRQVEKAWCIADPAH